MVYDVDDDDNDDADDTWTRFYTPEKKTTAYMSC
jgi:hypothetical protein